MSRPLRTLEPVTPEEAVAAHIAGDGAVIVHGLVSPGRLARLSEELDRAAAGVAPGPSSPHEDAAFFYGRNTVRVTGLLRWPAVVELVTSPLLLAVARQVLDEPVERLLLNSVQAIFIGPRQPGQPLHRDEDSWPLPGLEGQVLLSAMVAIDDFTAENGATRVVVGSHHRRDPVPEPPAAAVMPKGSALLYCGSVVHGGGENTTDTVRRGLYVGYVAGWLRPEEAHLEELSREALHALPPLVRRLAGAGPFPRRDGRGGPLNLAHMQLEG